MEYKFHYVCINEFIYGVHVDVPRMVLAMELLIGGLRVFIKSMILFNECVFSLRVVCVEVFLPPDIWVS